MSVDNTEARLWLAASAYLLVRQPYGNKRETRRVSLGEIKAAFLRLRLRLVVLLVRMCCFSDFLRTILPLPVNLNRLAAPRCVFILGIPNSLPTVCSSTQVDLNCERASFLLAGLPRFHAGDTRQDNVHLVALHAWS